MIRLKDPGSRAGGGCTFGWLACHCSALCFLSRPGARADMSGCHGRR